MAALADNRIEKQCPQCGGTFSVKFKARRQVFCSVKCHNASRATNVVSVEGECACIKLAGGNEVLVDAADLPLVSAFCWYVSNAKGRTRYAQASNGPGLTVLMHRLVMGMATGDPQVDHINGNGLDNRRSNLRLCTQEQNSWNRRQPRTKAPYRGIKWTEKKRKWDAVIGFKGKKHWLGSFTDPADAARAYDVAAREFFGEFAVVNFE